MQLLEKYTLIYIELEIVSDFFASFLLNLEEQKWVSFLLLCLEIKTRKFGKHLVKFEIFFRKFNLFL